MKEERYSIDACHPIFSRVVKYNLTWAQMNYLKISLLKMGFERQDILVVLSPLMEGT